MTPSKTSWPEGTIFTLGHSTLSIESFVQLLKTYGIQTLVDVRTVPRSRYNPQFNEDALVETLPEQGIAYRSMRALGGLRKARADSPNTGWRNGGFRGYADYMLTEEFAAALDELIALCKTSKVAIMCAEAVPWRCHRSLIADALTVRNIPVIEVLSSTKWRPRELTSFAKVEGASITYPSEQYVLL